MFWVYLVAKRPVHFGLREGNICLLLQIGPSYGYIILLGPHINIYILKKKFLFRQKYCMGSKYPLIFYQPAISPACQLPESQYLSAAWVVFNIFIIIGTKPDFSHTVYHTSGERAQQRPLISSVVIIDFYSKEKSLLSFLGNAFLGVCTEMQFQCKARVKMLNPEEFGINKTWT